MGELPNLGAARSRLATRESFFGGPISTRELCKAPNWQDLLKQEAEARAKPAPTAGKRDGGVSKAPARPAGPARVPSPDPELLRREKVKQRRDFSGLDDDSASASVPKPGPSSLARPTPAGSAAFKGQAAGKPAAGGAGGAAKQRPQQLSAATAARSGAGSAPSSQQQKSSSAAARPLHGPAAAKGPGLAHKAPGTGSAAGGRQGGGERASTHVVVVKAGAGGRGSKGAASRKMAIEPTAVGKSRKQLASEALQARCDQMRAESGKPARQEPVAPTSSAAPSPSPAAASAAAEAARKAREAQAAAARGVMQKQRQQTGLGMQTQLLIRRPAGQQGLQAARSGAGPSTGASAGAAVGGGSGKLKWDQLSPQQQQRQEQQAAAGQGRGSFYGSKQPLGVLDAVQRAKRRLSMDSQGELDDFIVDGDEEGYSDEEELGDYRDGDWRAELRSVLGGYDPSKFADIDRLPDRDMEAGFTDIVREEARSKRIARAEDAREEELERLREANKREKKRRKKGAAAFLDDD